MTRPDLSSTAPPADASDQLRPLDAIRGIAAFLVIVFHFEMQGDYIPGASLFGASLRTFVQHGYLAVDMFLVLSGYILARKYGGMRLGDHRAYLDFLFKRLARVYPLYIVMTGCVLAWWALDPAAAPPDIIQDPARAILPNLVLVQHWGLSFSIVSPSWSLSAECLVYLAFPLLMAWLMAGGRRALAVNAVLVTVVIGLLMASTEAGERVFDLHGSNDPRSLLRIAAGFCLGALAWRFEALGGVRGLPRMVRAGLAPVAALVVVAAMASPGAVPLIVLSFPLLLVALSGSGKVTQRVLTGPVLSAAGSLSYGVYLIHNELHPMRTMLDQVISGWSGPAAGHYAALLLTLVACYGLAALAYRLIEQPARTGLLSMQRARRDRLRQQRGELDGRPANPALVTPQ